MVIKNKFQRSVRKGISFAWVNCQPAPARQVCSSWSVPAVFAWAFLIVGWRPITLISPIWCDWGSIAFISLGSCLCYSVTLCHFICFFVVCSFTACASISWLCHFCCLSLLACRFLRWCIALLMLSCTALNGNVRWSSVWLTPPLIQCHFNISLPTFPPCFHFSSPLQ